MVRGDMMRFAIAILPVLCGSACDDNKGDSPEASGSAAAASGRATADSGSAADSGEAAADSGAIAQSADSGTADHAALSCAAANDMLAAQASKLAGSLACTTDADCATFTPDVRCGMSTHLSLCPIAVASSTRDQVTTAFGELAVVLCGSLVDTCKGSPSCPALVGKCNAKTCTVVAQP